MTDTINASVRDITKIAKTEHLLVTLQTAIDKLRKELAEWAGKFLENPLNQLSWSREVWSKAARLDVLLTLRLTIDGAHRAGDTEWTRDRIKTLCIENGAAKARYDAVPRSSSPTSNLADQHMIEAWFVAVDQLGWFRDAQDRDPEYKAHWEREYAEQKARARRCRPRLSPA